MQLWSWLLCDLCKKFCLYWIKMCIRQVPFVPSYKSPVKWWQFGYNIIPHRLWAGAHLFINTPSRGSTWFHYFHLILDSYTKLIFFLLGFSPINFLSTLSINKHVQLVGFISRQVKATIIQSHLMIVLIGLLFPFKQGITGAQFLFVRIKWKVLVQVHIIFAGVFQMPLWWEVQNGCLQ